MTMAFLGELAYTWLTILSCHGSIPAPYVIETDGSLSTLYHLCQLVYQQWLLKTFPSLVYLHFKDEVVWLWHFRVVFHLYGLPFYLATTQSECLIAIDRDFFSILYLTSIVIVYYSYTVQNNILIKIDGMVYSYIVEITNSYKYYIRIKLNLIY